MKKYFIVEYHFEKNKITQAEIAEYIKDALLSHCGGYDADDNSAQLTLIRTASSTETKLLKSTPKCLIK